MADKKALLNFLIFYDFEPGAGQAVVEWQVKRPGAVFLFFVYFVLCFFFLCLFVLIFGDLKPGSLFFGFLFLFFVT